MGRDKTNGPLHAFRMRWCLHAFSRDTVALAIGAALSLLATGCRHRSQQAYGPPPPSRTAPPYQSSKSKSNESSKSKSNEDAVATPHGKPTFVETGMASWYGPSGHRTADGSPYNGSGMTAAHKTLALGTVARVTNLANGESVMVRITDRGPFSHGRVLDLSESAAKEIGLYRMGVARVKIEAFSNATASVSGKWCVQTGAFKSERDALDLKSALVKRYAGARVIEFTGATGYWVRIDPVRHDHADAAAIRDWIGSPDPEAVPYIVRVD
jgi:rare lipoprotein A